ncbi:sodium-dependent transporter [Methanobrevibacter sp.]|uniref:sodium-dependent transporter n=1 Tax=Methanobrevibacter sp. TaxID=66852 RepID=UPI0025FAF0AD|nr:sodium-dependent transporter [Methanobrevibacter sp.]MBQ6511844.1 sodium-dependent transporter [Methanobrevibacter sp.]
MTKENEWGSNISFILAMIGSSVGLGNIWRYPYILYSNGGGAFYIPYLIAILVLAIPVLVLEYGVGYNYKSSFTKAIININPKLEYYAWILPIVIFVMTIYYSTIIGWDGIYLILSFFKGWGSDPNAFLTNSVLHSTHSVYGVLNFIPAIGISMIVVWFIIWLVSHRNLENGLGKISKIFVPLLFFMMILLVGVSLMLPGASIGLAELFNPNLSLLGHFDIWMAAFGQVFFSLSLGMGIGFTFSSYTKKDIDLVTSGLYVVIANCAFENFAALGVFSILGYMSLQSGTSVSNLVSQGSSLIFVAYPEVLNVLGNTAFILGPLLFLTVYIAGITSMLSSFEVFSCSIQNKLGFSRKRTTTILCIVGGIISMLYASSAGEYMVSITDLFVNNIAILFSVVVECLLFSWMFNSERLIGFLNSRSNSLKIGKWWLMLVRYVVPVLISVIWLGGVYELAISGSWEVLSLLILLSVIVLILALIFTVLPPKFKNWFEAEERIN